MLHYLTEYVGSNFKILINHRNLNSSYLITKMNFTEENNFTEGSSFTTTTDNYSGVSLASTSSINAADTGWSSGNSLEDHLVVRIIYGGIAVLGIVGNFLVIFTVARVSSLRTLTNVFIVSLAICDFITSVFLIPLHLGKYNMYLSM